MIGTSISILHWEYLIWLSELSIEKPIVSLPFIYFSREKVDQSIFFHNSSLIRRIQQNKIYKNI